MNLTLKQFYLIPEDELGHSCELDRGQLVGSAPWPAGYELLKCRIAEILGGFVRANQLGQVLVGSGYEIDHESWRRADVSFLSQRRLETLDRSKALTGAPDLAVEVVLPWASRRALNRKVHHFLDAGALVVWAVYPDSEEMDIVTKGGEEWLGPEDVLQEPLLLPGFSASVRSIFDF